MYPSLLLQLAILGSAIAANDSIVAYNKKPTPSSSYPATCPAPITIDHTTTCFETIDHITTKTCYETTTKTYDHTVTCFETITQVNISTVYDTITFYNVTTEYTEKTVRSSLSSVSRSAH